MTGVASYKSNLVTRALHDIFDVLSRFECLVGQNLLNRGDHLGVCPGSLCMHYKFIFVQWIGKGAQHLIELAALIKLSKVNLHTTPSLGNTHEVAPWLMSS